MKRVLFIYSIFLLALTYVKVLAQENNTEPIKTIFYYNTKWELTTPENSIYKREAYFDLKDMLFDGVYKDLSKDDKLIGDGYYQRGERSGMQTEYFEDQTIKTTIEYTDKGFILWQKMTPDKKFEVAKGTGKFSLPCFYFFDMRIKQGILHGEFLNGKRVGLWIYTDTGGKKTDTEHYEDGKLMKHFFYRQTDSVSVNYGKNILLSLNSINTQGLAFDKTVFATANDYFEKYVLYPTSFSRQATFPMGIKRLIIILTEELSVPHQNLLIAKLKIDEHGKQTKLGLARSLFNQTDDNALKLLKGYESLFFPAIEKGKPVPSTLYVPVASGEEWMELLRTMPGEYFTNISNFQ